MKKNDLAETKILDDKALGKKASSLQQEISELVLDKNIGKLKDIKIIFKKRKDLAQVLTVLRQKQLLGELQKQEEKKERKQD